MALKQLLSKIMGRDDEFDRDEMRDLLPEIAAAAAAPETAPEGEYFVGGPGPYAPKDITICMDDFPEATIISDGVKYTLEGSGENLELVREDDDE